MSGARCVILRPGYDWEPRLWEGFLHSKSARYTVALLTPSVDAIVLADSPQACIRCVSAAFCCPAPSAVRSPDRVLDAPRRRTADAGSVISAGEKEDAGRTRRAIEPVRGHPPSGHVPTARTKASANTSQSASMSGTGRSVRVSARGRINMWIVIGPMNCWTSATWGVRGCA